MRHNLILNNELGKAIRLTPQNTTSIINLMLTTPEVGKLDTWIIDEELSTPTDHEVIVSDLANLDETIGGMGTSQKVTGWSVKGLSKEAKKEASADYHRAAAERP